MATMAGRGPPEDAVDGEEVLVSYFIPQSFLCARSRLPLPLPSPQPTAVNGLPQQIRESQTAP